MKAFVRMASPWESPIRGAMGFATSPSHVCLWEVPDLQNQTVIVTGASSGIGEAAVVRLAKAGANLVLFARRADRLEVLARRVDPSGRQTLVVPGDLTSAESRQRLVDETVGRFGCIHGLVNNAGFGQRGPIECVSLEAIRRNFETNVFSLLGLTQLVAPIMRQQKQGRIINIGSVAGRIARPMSSVYDATKHALEAFSDGLRGELKPFGIHVVLVRPGFIMTEFVDASDAASVDVIQNPGPYAPYVESFRGGAKKLRSVAGSPDDIAKIIEHALSTRSPKSHYAAPVHAKVFLALKWFLPVRVLDWVTRLRK